MFYYLFLIGILADCNRIPYDLAESESELIAGFITEYSSIYFSLLLLIEYCSLISWLMLFLLMINANYLWLVLLLLFVISLIRASLNRLKFDELMINCWLLFLPIIFSLLLIVLLI